MPVIQNLPLSIDITQAGAEVHSTLIAWARPSDSSSKLKSLILYDVSSDIHDQYVHKHATLVAEGIMEFMTGVDGMLLELLEMPQMMPQVQILCKHGQK